MKGNAENIESLHLEIHADRSLIIIVEKLVAESVQSDNNVVYSETTQRDFIKLIKNVLIQSVLSNTPIIPVY